MSEKRPDGIERDTVPAGGWGVLHVLIEVS